MEETIEYHIEILKLVELARKNNQLIGNYVQHYIVLEPKNGYKVILSNDKCLFINKRIVQDFQNLPSSISSKDLQNIANTLTDF